MTDYPKDFSSDFSYHQWTNNTEITLALVPWSNAMDNVVRFPTAEGLDRYIDQRPSTHAKIVNAKYAAIHEPIKINLPFSIATRYNYVRARNRRQSALLGDLDTTFYYFITGVRFEAGNTTSINVQLDVWSTYNREIKIVSCYLIQGHAGIANENNFSNYGRDFLTVPEGLDVGASYVTRAIAKETLIEGNSFNILAASSIDLDENPWNGNEPVLKTAPGSRFGGMPSGASYYIWESVNSFSSFMRNYSNAPHVTQGILSITAIPQLSRYYENVSFDDVSDLYSGINAGTWGNHAIQTHDMLPDWRNDARITSAIPARYAHLRKFFTFPFMLIEMTTYTGTPIALRPEEWNNANAKIAEQAALTPPNQRVQFFPVAYNGKESEPVPGRANTWGGEGPDMITVIANFPSFALVNNAALGFLSANFHSIAYAQSAADWSQQRALEGNRVSYDQASQDIALSTQLNKLSNAADSAQTGLGLQAQAQGLAVSTTASVFKGGIGYGATVDNVAAAIQMANDVSNSQKALGIRNLSSTMANSAGGEVAEYIRDTNKGLADWATKGDYAQTIAGNNAKIQDAKMFPPTTSGQVGGEMLNILHDQTGVYLKFKTIDDAAIRRVGELWLRYGYQVQQFTNNIPDDFMVMSKFTYWRMAETRLRSAPIPEAFKAVFRGIFEKGVTVWSDPADLEAYNFDMATNNIKAGYTL